MAKFTPTTAFDERLTESIASNTLTIPVSSVKDRDGVLLPISATNKGYFTIEPGTSREESIVCDDIQESPPALIVATNGRGLAASGDSETGSGTRAYSHNAGSKIIMTDISQFFGNFVDTKNAETIAGIKTFSASPIVPTPTTATQAANKDYVDNVAISGGANASSTVKGISKLSSDPSVLTEPIALNSEEVSDISAANKVPRANANGLVDSGFVIDTDGNTGLEEGADGGTKVKVKSGAGVIIGADGLEVDTGTTDGKIVQMTTGDKLPAVDGSNLTNLSPQSNFQILGKLAQTGITMAGAAIATDTSDNSIYLAYNAPNTSYNSLAIFRLAKDAKTGNYKNTHSVLITAGGSSYWTYVSLTVMGDYVYFSRSNSTNIYRVNKADLTSETTIAFSGGDPNTGTKYLFNDGTFVYVYNRSDSYNIKKYSVSGSTFTYVSQVASADTGSIIAGTWLDATNFYFGGGGSLYIINRTTGAVSTSSVYPAKIEILAAANQSFLRVSDRVLSLTANNTGITDAYSIVYLDWFSSTAF